MINFKENDEYNKIIDYIINWKDIKSLESKLFQFEFINYITQKAFYIALNNPKYSEKEQQLFFSVDITKFDYVNINLNNWILSKWLFLSVDSSAWNKIEISIGRYEELKELLENDIYQYITKNILKYYHANELPSFFRQFKFHLI
jgi:hypothetical protein